MKNMYVLPHHLYDRHTWKGDDIERGDPTHQITWPWNYLVRRQIKNLVSALSQQIWPPNLAGWWPTVRGARTPGYVIFFTMWSHEKWKRIASTLPHYLRPPNMTRWLLWLRELTIKSPELLTPWWRKRKTGDFKYKLCCFIKIKKKFQW